MQILIFLKQLANISLGKTKKSIRRKMTGNDEIDSIYEIGERIGAGGGGIAYRGFHKRLGKALVFKEIRGDRIVRERYRDEIDHLKTVKSAYLPQAFDFIETKDSAYTVVEYIDGISFGELMEQGRHFSEKDCRRWFHQLAEALDTLHSCNPPIAHGDIKPDNIMLTKRGDVCLIDFNVSVVLNKSENRATGYTGAYAAPEQIMGWIDVRSDIYSLGASMYQIFSGVRPLPAGNPQHDIRNIAPGNISEPFANIIMRCIENRPKDRYQNTNELLAALDRVDIEKAAYRSLAGRQRAVRFLLLGGTAASVIVMLSGILKLRQERELAYQKEVQIITDAGALDDEDMLNKAFDNATAMFQGKADAYVEKTRFLYEHGRYDEAIAFALNGALPYVTEETAGSNLYLLTGRCYEELGDYVRAEDALLSAVSADENNSAALEELAVVMAKTGRTAEAYEYLNKAESVGSMSETIDYTQGEIFLSEGRGTEAQECFLRVIEKTDDNYLKSRAYLNIIAAIKSEPITETSIKERIKLANEAVGNLPAQYQNALRQEAVQAQIDLSMLTGEEQDAREALDMLEKLSDDGLASFDTRQSMILICQEFGFFEKERSLLAGMEEIYGEDYRIFADYAYMELVIQQKKDLSERNYEAFETAYKKAFKLYEAQKKENQADARMQNLEQLYRDVVDGGWLKGE